MDSNISMSNQENNEPKAEFRKLTNEAANRKYRRHSPDDGSSDEDGISKHDHGSRGNSKASGYERKNDDRDFGRSQHGRNDESSRHSSRGYQSRHDDHSRHGKYADEDERGHAKSSIRSGRDSRGGNHSDYRDRDSDYNRSRDHHRDVDKYSRERSDVDRKYKTGYDGRHGSGYDGRHGSRYDDRDRRARNRDDQDERKDYRSSRDYKNDRTTYNEDSRGHENLSSKREESELKGLDGSKYAPNKYDGLDRHESKYTAAGGRSETEGFAIKKPKFSSGDSGAREADERQTSGSKHEQEHLVDVAHAQDTLNDSDTANVDAAKVAAMKAAELVNKNLAGTGFMTADQKKKLLWGNKKNSNAEESSHRWDTSLFSDRDRQEKFNKLMGVKNEAKVESKVSSSQDVEKQREVQLDLEKQYTAGLRRRDGRTVGLGL